MSDENTGAASAPVASNAPATVPGFIGGFPPAALVRDVAPVVETPVEAPTVESIKPVPAQPGLADLIRKQREDRLAREQSAAQAKDWETKYNELKAQSEKQGSFEDDPVAYARAKKWDKEKQALYGQTLLYDLVPDKAPSDLRIKLFESKQAQKDRDAEESRKAEAQAAEQRARQETMESFVAVLDQSAAAFEPGSYPESQAWFLNPETGEMDHDTYVRSLVATAVNLSNVAQREGRVADLTPVSIAKTLEADVARRMVKRDEKRKATAAAKPVQPVVQQMPQGSGVQPTESTKGTYGSGAPVPKAKDERERLQRAMAVAFRTPGSR